MDDKPTRAQPSRRGVRDSGRQGESRRESRDGDAQPPGWRVTPAPDGRGVTEPGTKPPQRPNSRWWIAAVVVGLLALNLWISSRPFGQGHAWRSRSPPTFLSQVQGTNVNSIRQGPHDSGDVRQPVTLPAAPRAPRDFTTEIPSSWHRLRPSGQRNKA